MLESATACWAIGYSIHGEEVLGERFDVEAGRAIEAGGQAGGAVKLQDAAAARELVQAVDVLGDDAADSAGGRPVREQLVADVRPGSGEVCVHFGFLSPVFVSGIGGG